ncbi:MAG: hypothetical protein ABI654_06565 [Betaproteobacteria bacterium]
MKNSKPMLKKLALVLLAGAGLSGCVAVPYGPSAYGGDPYYGAPVYGPAVVVPSISLGIGLGGHGYRGGRGRW